IGGGPANLGRIERRGDDDLHARSASWRSTREHAAEKRAHLFGDEIPIILFDNELMSVFDRLPHLVRVRENMLDCLRYLRWRVLVHRPTGCLLTWIPLRIEEEVGDTTFLCRDNGQPCRHRLNE